MGWESRGVTENLSPPPSEVMPSPSFSFDGCKKKKKCVGLGVPKVPFQYRLSVSKLPTAPLLKPALRRSQSCSRHQLASRDLLTATATCLFLKLLLCTRRQCNLDFGNTELPLWNVAVLIVSEKQPQVGFANNRYPWDKRNVYWTGRSYMRYIALCMLYMLSY